MRYMIVHRLRRFPEKYFKNIKDSQEYCNNMATYRKDATEKELQAAADIFFAVIECYSINDPFEPTNVIWPLRCPKIPVKDTNTLKLWTHGTHCMALVDDKSQPLIQNIFDEPDIGKAISLHEREEESGRSRNSQRNDSVLL